MQPLYPSSLPFSLLPPPSPPRFRLLIQLTLNGLPSAIASKAVVLRSTERRRIPKLIRQHKVLSLSIHRLNPVQKNGRDNSSTRATLTLDHFVLS